MAGSSTDFIYKLVDSSQLDSDLTTVANAIRTKGGTSEQLAFPQGMAQAIADLPSGGATITDGIVVKSRNAQEYATEIDLYASDGKIKESQFFCQASSYGAWIKLETVNLKNTITNIGHYAFYFAGSGGNGLDLDLSNVTTIDGSAFEGSGLKNFNCNANIIALNLNNNKKLQTIIATNATGNVYFTGCTSLTTVQLPKVTALANGGRSNCRAVTSCEIGSIGYGNPGTSNTIGTGAFTGWTQTGLTITMYASDGSTVDYIVSCVRSGATNATIIIKASKTTTYSGNTYAAGDTIITSNP